ncbi:MAG: ATP-binding protein [Acidobacteriota bacterium]
MPRGTSKSLIDRLLSIPRVERLAIALAGIALIAFSDWNLAQVSLGSIYILPILFLSGALSRKQVVLLAISCTFLRIALNPPSDLITRITNTTNSFLAYALIGLFALELVNSRQRMLDLLTESQRQQVLLRNAQTQLRLLAESSPAAIFTLSGSARILSANRATHELLGLPPDFPVLDYCVEANLPSLADALRMSGSELPFRTSVQVQGIRWDGTPFLAQAWFSTYSADDDSVRLAAIAIDNTEETCEREEQSQEQILQSSRIVVGALAHEVRNVSGAMSVVYSNLGRMTGLQDNQDYVALGQLVAGIGRLARVELEGAKDIGISRTNLRDVLNQLRILIGPSWDEQGAEIYWPDSQAPVVVGADAFTLLQAFLNISNNSLTAIRRTDRKSLFISVETTNKQARISFTDSGVGISDPDVLFQPFRSPSGTAGLGLYISRALLRRYGGDVQYDPAVPGARFIVEVPLYGVHTHAIAGHEHHSALASR